MSYKPFKSSSQAICQVLLFKPLLLAHTHFDSFTTFSGCCNCENGCKKWENAGDQYFAESCKNV